MRGEREICKRQARVGRTGAKRTGARTHGRGCVRVRRLMRFKASGSYTVEAALVCSFTLLVIGSLISQAFIMHDRTAANMILQETVEMGRRLEEDRKLEEARESGMSQTWILHRINGYQISLEQEGNRVHGRGNADGFSNDISVPGFDPEAFLRMIEGLSGLGGLENGD